MLLALKQATTTVHNEDVLVLALPLLISSSSSNAALVRRLPINRAEGSGGLLPATTLTKAVGTTTGADHPKEGATRAVVGRQSASWATDTAMATGEEGRADR